jgi:phosphatidylserine/phosphatidylglycerophosphate/cardiolipin synthase-like enzyme
MMTLSSTGAMLAALRAARNVTLTAYTLPAGRVLDGLIAAAAAGARVRVELEGEIYKDDGTIAGANAAAALRLRGAGADVRFVHEASGSSEPLLHAKTASIDGTLFLDDRNWPDDGEDTIVRDGFAADARIVRDAVAGRTDAPTPFFAVAKREALASEARLIDEARAGDAIVAETESFGPGNRVDAALERAAQRGVRVRLLISERDARGNSNERAAIERLRRDGAQVRRCAADEKFAVVRGSRGWIGSANATAAFSHPDQIDWGARTDAPEIIAHLRQAFARRWSSAAAITSSRVVS